MDYYCQKWFLLLGGPPCWRKDNFLGILFFIVSGDRSARAKKTNKDYCTIGNYPTDRFQT